MGGGDFNDRPRESNKDQSHPSSLGLTTHHQPASTPPPPPTAPIKTIEKFLNLTGGKAKSREKDFHLLILNLRTYLFPAGTNPFNILPMSHTP